MEGNVTTAKGGRTFLLAEIATELKQIFLLCWINVASNSGEISIEMDVSKCIFGSRQLDDVTKSSPRLLLPTWYRQVDLRTQRGNGISYKSIFSQNLSKPLRLYLWVPCLVEQDSRGWWWKRGAAEVFFMDFCSLEFYIDNQIWRKPGCECLWCLWSVQLLDCCDVCLAKLHDVNLLHRALNAEKWHVLSSISYTSTRALHLWKIYHFVIYRGPHQRSGIPVRSLW